MSAVPPIDKPAYQAPLVQPNGAVHPTWLRWFNQIRAASESLATANAAITAIRTQMSSGTSSVTALTASVGAANAAIAQLTTALAALEAATESGALTEAVSDVLTITGGAGAVLGAGAAIQVKRASASEDGYLAAADFAAFAAAAGAATHEEILVDSTGPVTQSDGDFIYVLGVPN